MGDRLIAGHIYTSAKAPSSNFFASLMALALCDPGRLRNPQATRVDLRNMEYIKKAKYQVSHHRAPRSHRRLARGLSAWCWVVGAAQAGADGWLH